MNEHLTLIEITRQQFEDKFPVPVGAIFNKERNLYQENPYSVLNLIKYNAMWRAWQASREEVESEPFAYFTESGGKDCFTTDKQAVSVPLEMACKIYNSGYQSGHHDTVEGGFTDVQYSDRGEHHSDEVQELLDELQEGE